MKTAFVFPGQGSQLVGMGKNMAENFLERANQVLGFDLKKLCFEGPEEELKKTEITQPAIFAVSLAAYDYLGQKPAVMAGHSLGEYSALCAAGAFSFEEGIKIVHLRGKFMQEAVSLGEGAMAAVLDLGREKIEECCERAKSKGVVSPANFNSPDQVVISGKKEAVEEASKLCREAGAKRVIPLQVSAPFHCELMKPAAEKLAVELEKIKIKNAKIPVVANVIADYVVEGDEIRRFLIEQVTHAVLWEDSVRRMIEDGVGKFVEVGPGKVLTGLIKKIDPNVEVRDYVGR